MSSSRVSGCHIKLYLILDYKYIHYSGKIAPYLIEKVALLLVRQMRPGLQIHMLM